MLTEPKRAKLAEFAGGERIETFGPAGKNMGYTWFFPDGPKIPCRNWHPDTNPAHGWLVLQALIEKDRGTARDLFEELSKMLEIHHKLTSPFWAYVCNTALELTDKKGR